MLIDLDFPKNHRPIGKHTHVDGEHYHFVSGPNRSNAETSSRPEVQEAYKTRNEEYIPLGIHGTMVAVDRDSCYVDGDCIEACPVQVFQWYRTENDLIVIKRRDGAFQDTELRVWLQSEGINTLVFCGIDTSICVETSLREAFNIGYDVILVSDATASGIKRHYETTLERVKDYYGLVLDTIRFYKLINSIEDLKSGRTNSNELNERYEMFLEEFRLIDIRKKMTFKIKKTHNDLE